MCSQMDDSSNPYQSPASIDDGHRASQKKRSLWRRIIEIALIALLMLVMLPFVWVILFLTPSLLVYTVGRFWTIAAYGTLLIGVILWQTTRWRRTAQTRRSE